MRVYLNPKNQRNVERGLKIIYSHPDYGKMTDGPTTEMLTAASDMIADILHALNAKDCFPRDERMEAQRLLERAHRAYEGDFEDEVDIVANLEGGA